MKKDELGDLTFHIVLYAELAEKLGQFTLEDILNSALQKQYHRRLSLENPHSTAEEAHAHWKLQKQKAKSVSKKEGLLADVPLNMSALLRSQKIQDRVGDVGFDWKDVHEVVHKLREEIDEFEYELKDRDTEGMLDELGDIFFTLVNVARHLDLDAEHALRQANNKFARRFRMLELQLEKRQEAIDSLSFDELLEVWEAVKKKEKSYKNK